MVVGSLLFYFSEAAFTHYFPDSPPPPMTVDAPLEYQDPRAPGAPMTAPAAALPVLTVYPTRRRCSTGAKTDGRQGRQGSNCTALMVLRRNPAGSALVPYTGVVAKPATVAVAPYRRVSFATFLVMLLLQALLGAELPVVLLGLIC